MDPIHLNTGHIKHGQGHFVSSTCHVCMFLDWHLTYCGYIHDWAGHCCLCYKFLHLQFNSLGCLWTVGGNPELLEETHEDARWRQQSSPLAVQMSFTIPFTSTSWLSVSKFVGSFRSSHTWALESSLVGSCCRGGALCSHFKDQNDPMPF